MMSTCYKTERVWKLKGVGRIEKEGEGCVVNRLEKTEPKRYVRKQMQSPVLSGPFIHRRWLREWWDQEAIVGGFRGVLGFRGESSGLLRELLGATR